MSNQTRTKPAVIVQIAQGFGASDATWTTPQTVDSDAATVGLGQVIGTVTLTETIGDVKPAGSIDNKVVRQPASALAAGMCVRLLVQDPTGSVTGVLFQQQITFRPFWWGVVIAPVKPINGGTQVPTTVGFSQSYQWLCQCTKSPAGRAGLGYGHDLTSGTLRRLEYLPVFNDTLRGNMSAGTTTIDGQTVRAFDFGPTGTRWTAIEAVKYLLAAFGRPQPLGVDAPAGPAAWVLDPATLTLAGLALAFRLPRMDLGGGQLFDALQAVITPDRGATWGNTVVNDQIRVQVYSTTDVDTGQGVATPVALDLRENIFVRDLQLQRDGGGFDYIEVVGERPTAVMTLKFTSGATGASTDQLIPDPTWLRTDIPTDRFGSGEAGTWRRYRLNPAGNFAALRNQLSAAVGGVPDGTRTAAGSTPSPLALELTSDLGVGQGFATTGDPQRPLVRVGSTDQRLEFPVAVLQDPPGVELGSDVINGQDLAGWLMSTGTELWVTIGVREWAPLKVAWMRTKSAWPAAGPRILTKRDPRFRQVYVLPGTWQGDDTAGAPIFTGGGGLMAYDSTSDMQTLLGLLRARYEVEGAIVSWAERGIIDVLSTPLGTFIGTVKTNGADETARAVVWQKTWTFGSSCETSYTTERPPINTDLYLRVES